MNIKLSIIGLGYVGLPLAIEFAKYFPTVGFDINLDRIKELELGKDHTLEVSESSINKSLIKHNPKFNETGFFPTNYIDNL